MSKNEIVIKGAKEHNLKNIDLTLPRNKLIVFTGVSGSGKSSLAFDTIYADGQRRYVESLSSYARQFLGQMEKPNVESIEGLSPAISIDQKTTSKNPRSTVGTITEIYDYLRLLYARVGVMHCPVCNEKIEKQSIDEIVDSILNLDKGTKIQILAPIVTSKKGEYKKEIEDAKKSGFTRIRVDGQIYDVFEEEINIEKTKKHNIEIVVDRLIIKNEIRSRLADSLEIAFNLSNNNVIINVINSNDIYFSKDFSCINNHHIDISELSPRMFSFNNPLGACSSCMGIGTFLKVDVDLIIPDKNLSIKQGAIKVSGWNYNDSKTNSSISSMYMNGLAKHYNFSLDTKIKDLDEKILNIILYGSKNEKIKFERHLQNGVYEYESTFEGIINNVERRYRETNSQSAREEISHFMTNMICSECNGDRLRKEVLCVTINEKNIMDICRLSIEKSLEFIDSLVFEGKDLIISKDIIKEIKERLNFLNNVGLSYLTLHRESSTLSGGESQRIRLATQIGSHLVGVIYILDEPSIGLHQRDNDKLINTLKELRDIGNTLIVVEHDEDTILNADYIVDIGPYAGVHGGEIVSFGGVEDIKKEKKSITGQYLSGVKKIEIPKKRRKGNGKKLIVKKASENNLKNIDVKINLGTFTCVTGVSGSGKSTLVNQIIYNYLNKEINHVKCKVGKCNKIDGVENIDKVIGIDQSPIGRTPRSNPSTYIGVFTDIREVFSMTNESKIRGYTASRFSFNVTGGRCESCCGDGIIKIEMHFLPDVYVPCDICKGKRYNRETLEVTYKDKNISDILDLTAEDALKFFENIPKIKRKLETLCEVGLGYLKLGQSATTLSGGEAQRVKLASELLKKPTGKTLYILDEPTTGLHIYDIHKLVNILHKLTDSGNTVLVIEHNLDMIKTCDYIIDMGYEGGDKGGEVIFSGTPEKLVQNENSYTGVYLKRYLL